VGENDKILEGILSTLDNEMVKRKRAAVLPTNVSLLQNLIKRDPK
jgi:hypothetical protein